MAFNDGRLSWYDLVLCAHRLRSAYTYFSNSYETYVVVIHHL